MRWPFTIFICFTFYFAEWRNDKNKTGDFEKLEAEDLAGELRQFYGDVRKENGEKYSKSSLSSIRAALQRHLTSAPHHRTINILTNELFNTANNVFDGSLKRSKRGGKDVSVGHPEISEEDLITLFESDVLTTKDPTALQRLIFFQVQYLFCRRGREGLRQLKKDSFAIRVDASGREFISPTANEHEKNHPGTLSSSSYQQMRQRVYATGEEQCPVRAFKLYLSKLHPLCPWFYQQPKRNIDPSKATLWYNNVPLGHNTIGNMMRDISAAAKLSQTYTNHSIRATAIRVLNNAGTSDRIICSLSGHRNVNSIMSYCRDASEQQKREMSNALSSSCHRHPAPHTVSAPPSSPSATSQHPQHPVNQHPTQPTTLVHQPRQPPMTGNVVRRQSGSTATETSATAIPSTATTALASANVLNMLTQPQQGYPAIFTSCNFDGATLNFHFNTGS